MQFYVHDRLLLVFKKYAAKAEDKHWFIYVCMHMWKYICLSKIIMWTLG